MEIKATKENKHNFLSFLNENNLDFLFDEKVTLNLFPGNLESNRREGKVKGQIEVEIVLSKNLHQVSFK